LRTVLTDKDLFMLEERIINLINAELDGELTDSERSELEAILRDSAEARTMRADLRRLGELMERLPAQEPPAGLSGQILNGVQLPRARTRVRRSFSPAGFLASLQPAQIGVGFAAGLLLAVGYFELSPANLGESDSARMVGTMVAGRQAGAETTANSLFFKESGISGTVTLRENGPYRILDFDLDSGDPAEVEIAFAEAGLSFGGIARTSKGPEMVGQSYEIAGGILRVTNQGQQAFSVFLRQTADEASGREGISIGISSGGEPRVSGVIQG
jgi:hypothetical protein